MADTTLLLRNSPKKKCLKLLEVEHLLARYLQKIIVLFICRFGLINYKIFFNYYIYIYISIMKIINLI